MKIGTISSIIAFLILALNLSAQELSVFANVNQYYSFGKLNNKSSHPILWYDSSEDEGLLFGGFGIGLKYKKNIKERLTLAGKGSFLRYRQYDEPIKLVDSNGASLGILNNVITELGIAGHFTLNYKFNEQFEIGSGLGLIGIISSKSDYEYPLVFQSQVESEVENNYYKPLILTVPLEVTYNLKVLYFALKYEMGLLNRFRGDINPRENSSILTFELGVNLSQIISFKILENDEAK